MKSSASLSPASHICAPIALISALRAAASGDLAISKVETLATVAEILDWPDINAKESFMAVES